MPVYPRNRAGSYFRSAKKTPWARTAGFYGLAAQDLESEWGGVVCFLEGASDSTHNLSLSGADAAQRIKLAVKETLAQAKEHPVTRLAAIKRPFRFKVRQFDEQHEDQAVTRYCRAHVGSYGETVIQPKNSSSTQSRKE